MSILDPRVLVILLPAWVMAAMLFWFMFVTPVLLAWEERWKVKLAKGMELGEGVTLLEGIRAFFGEDGHWGTIVDVVRVYVGEPTIYFNVVVEKVDKETILYRPYVLRHDWSCADAEEMEEVFDMLIEAAKEQRAHSQNVNSGGA